MKKGIIFNIQRFSVHDGPGIRTTVFLKGCPLRCKWCANPESNQRKAQLLHSSALCIGCRSCEGVCPAQAIHFENGAFAYDQSLCLSCFDCVGICPTHALTRAGTWYTVEEVVNEVRKDAAFYEGSGGGVTLSGGEPLFQKAFTRELLQELKAQGFHTNIETTGYAPQEYFASVLPYLDMVYIDFKHPDSKRHKEGTGVPNKRIVENLAWLLRQELPVTVRIPVIPRFNCSAQTAHDYGRLLAELGAREVHLLPFHQLGRSKWHSLGLEYEYENEASMQEEGVAEMAAILTSYGLQVQING